MVNRYEVFRADIEPKGFEVAVLDGFLTDERVARVRALLRDSALRAEVVDRNYEIGRSYYSYRRLESSLRRLLDAG